MRIVVTGGAGFIGSALVRRALDEGHDVLNIDSLSYAANPSALAACAANPRYHFSRTDITGAPALAQAVRDFDPDAILHLAAESHVDRSIDGPAPFVETNIVGSFNVLEIAMAQHARLSGARRDGFRLVMVSTDEVCGSLGAEGHFDEASPLAPNSPYAASKAAAELLARAWTRTYAAPVIVTRCSNNYGPWQHPEKLIPTIIRSALEGAPIGIYGDGAHVRDWLYVEDHVDGLLRALTRGETGETYMFGGGAEISNRTMAEAICALLDEMAPRADGPHARAIASVKDRPGHDFRYAVDCTRVARDLGWRAATPFEQGLRQTLAWYLEDRSRIGAGEPRRGLRRPEARP